MSFTLQGPVLKGALVRLEPLERRDAAEPAVAAEEDRRTYAFTWAPRAPETDDHLDAQLAPAATGRLAPYAQISLATTAQDGAGRHDDRATTARRGTLPRAGGRGARRGRTARHTPRRRGRPGLLRPSR